MSRTNSIELTGSEENRLSAEIFGTDGRPVLFFHGGGQTRHAWNASARHIADHRMRAITVDLRGHGDSEWVKSENYSFDDFSKDVSTLFETAQQRYGMKPVAVGASLGGLASLAAEIRHPGLLHALVLVDITPKMDPDGVARIQGFMGEHLEQGFANLEEAADAIARYLPHRRRPSSFAGLKKNLRLGADGRYRWHWDPAFINGKNSINAGALVFVNELMNGLAGLELPVLLVRGMQSELVSKSHAREFVALTPNASYVDVGGAGHMVAGDHNDVFCDAMMHFLTADLPG